MRRVCCILLCLLLLSSYTIAAGKEESLEIRIKNFMYENGLTEENFALSYFNVDSGETYNFNDTTFFDAGEVWTLPLHMYYCLEEYHGAFLPKPNDPNYQNPDYEYTINGMTLDTCRTESILSGNQNVSQAMREEVMQYHDTINEEFGHILPEELPTSYYTDNCYSTQFLMNCLIELDRESAIYGELMRLYDLSQSPEGFRNIDIPITNKYKTVQVRGQENGMVCCVAEVTAPDTYLLACFVSRKAGGDRILSGINELICTYIEESNEHSMGVLQESTQVGVVRTDKSFQTTSMNHNNFSGISKWIIIALVGAAVVALVLFFIDRLIRHIRRKKHSKHKSHRKHD